MLWKPLSMSSAVFGGSSTAAWIEPANSAAVRCAWELSGMSVTSLSGSTPSVHRRPDGKAVAGEVRVRDLHGDRWHGRRRRGGRFRDRRGGWRRRTAACGEDDAGDRDEADELAHISS